MIMRSIIFDMDLTLVDTTCLEELRHKREWSQVYNLIPQTSMYAGMADVLEVIRKHNIKTAIVSTSPRPYTLPLLLSYTTSLPESQFVIRNWTVQPIGMSLGSCLTSLDITSSTLLKPMSVNSPTTLPLKYARP